MLEFNLVGVLKYAILYWILCLTLILFSLYLPDEYFGNYPMNALSATKWRDNLLHKVNNNYNNDPINSFINLISPFKTTTSSLSVAAAIDFTPDINNTNNHYSNSNWLSTIIVIISSTTNLFLHYLKEALAILLGFAFMFTNFRGLIDIPLNFVNFLIGNSYHPNHPTTTATATGRDGNFNMVYYIGRRCMKFIHKIFSSFLSILNRMSGGRLPTSFLLFQTGYNDNDDDYGNSNNRYGCNYMNNDNIYDDLPMLEADPVLLPFYLDTCQNHQIQFINSNNTSSSEYLTINSHMIGMDIAESYSNNNNSSSSSSTSTGGTSSRNNNSSNNKNSCSSSSSSSSNSNNNSSNSNNRSRSSISSSSASYQINSTTDVSTSSSQSYSASRQTRTRSRRRSLCSSCNASNNYRNGNHNKNDNKNDDDDDDCKVSEKGNFHLKYSMNHNMCYCYKSDTTTAGDDTLSTTSTTTTITAATAAAAAVTQDECCIFDPVYGVIPTDIWERWQQQSQQQYQSQQLKSKICSYQNADINQTSDKIYNSKDSLKLSANTCNNNRYSNNSTNNVSSNNNNNNSSSSSSSSDSNNININRSNNKTIINNNNNNNSSSCSISTRSQSQQQYQQRQQQQQSAQPQHSTKTHHLPPVRGSSIKAV